MHFRDSRISCQICDYQTTRNYNLSKHVKNVHQRNENINCTECNESVKEWCMKSHLKLHSKQQTQYSCNVCPYRTIHSNYDLKCHIERVHMSQYSVVVSIVHVLMLSVPI